MGRTATVFLGDVRTGTLHEADDGFVELRIDPTYLSMVHRPVLGQWFEDHPGRTQRGDRPGVLPPFLANYIPEGHLRAILEDRLQVAPGDDFALLTAVGRDLPGAIEIHPDEGAATATLLAGVPATLPHHDPAEGFHFSLAGVQLKFSLLRRGDRFNLAGHDERGDWIAKISFPEYGDLCANEYVTMEWARAAGFDVPTCELRTVADLVDVPHGEPAETATFLIRRFDRGQGRKIHQEDFQQIVGRRPDQKYDHVTYEALVLLATKIVGDLVYDEMIRRLAFIVASGNNDAHLKNWSVFYPDRVRARLTPLYDQVFTAQWPKYSIELALKLGGTKQFAAIEMSRFQEVARRVGRDPKKTTEVVQDAIAQAAASWPALRDHPATTDRYREALRIHWQKVPILRPHSAQV